MNNQADYLKEFCERLLSISHQIGEINIENEDNFGFMIRAFLDKQMDHMDSLIKLHPKNDMQLISRSMIEGYCIIKWASMDQERSLKWRSFIYIHNYRVMKLQEKKGMIINTEFKIDTEDKLKKHSHLFMKKKVRDGDDPYYKSWKCTTNISEMAKEAKAKILYESIYSSLSDWQHWGPASLSVMIDRFSDGYGYNPEHGSKLASTSFAVGFQCLYQILSMLCEHFSSQLKNTEMNLASLFQDYREFNEKHVIKQKITTS